MGRKEHAAAGFRDRKALARGDLDVLESRLSRMRIPTGDRFRDRVQRRLIELELADIERSKRVIEKILTTR